MHRFTDMHCSRDVSEKIHQKRLLSPLPVSIQVVRLWGAGCGRQEMLLYHITDTKPSEKSTSQAALHWRWKLLALGIGSLFLLWILLDLHLPLSHTQ